MLVTETVLDWIGNLGNRTAKNGSKIDMVDLLESEEWEKLMKSVLNYQDNCSGNQVMEQSDSLIVNEQKQPSWIGYVDEITESSVHGWICDSNNFDLSLEVEIYADGVKIGETSANNYRPDLRDAGLGNGNHGFNFSFPVRIESQKITVNVKNYDYEVSKSGALLEKEAPTENSPPPTTIQTTLVDTEESELAENTLKYNRQQENQVIENWLLCNKEDYQFSNEAFPVVISINPYQVDDRTFVEMAQPLSDKDFIRATFIVYLEREPTVEEKQLYHSDISMRGRYVLPRTLRQTSAFLERRNPHSKDNIFLKIFKGIFIFFRRLINRDRFIEIIDIVNSCLSDQEYFWGGWIDFPQKNQKYWSKQLTVAGWVMGKKYPVISLKLILGKKVIQEVPVNSLRLDVVECYVLQPNGWLELCGYNATVNLKDFPSEGVLILEAVFSNNEAILVGKIRFTK